MKFNRLTFTILIISGISIVLAGLLYGIMRVHDPIIIQGKTVPSFLGQPVENIRVFRYNAFKVQWEPILFQVDELDNSEDYYGDKDGKLSERDEIVFMTNDLGSKAPDTVWPSDVAARHHNRYEIIINDPIGDGYPGYAYVYLSASLETAIDGYFHIDENEDWVKTPTYTVSHGDHGFQSGLFLHKAFGGDSINIVERQKFRVIARISGINKEIPIQEEQDATYKFLFGTISIDVYVGPKDIQYLPESKVRLHRYLELEYRFHGNVVGSKIDRKGSYFFLTTFYPTFAEWQMQTTIDEIENTQIREIRITTDLRSNAWGMQFYNPYNHDPPLRIDKTGNDYDDQIDWPGSNWYMIVANPDDPDKVINKATLLTITKIPSVPNYSEGRLYFKDSQDKVTYDTGDNKSWGDTGFQMKGDDLKGDIAFYSASYYLPENFTYEDGENLYSNQLFPLQVDAASQILTYRLIVNNNLSIGGSAVVSPQNNAYPAYSMVTIMANPNPGYDFIGWTGDIISNENPLTFEIQDNTTLTANFEPRMHYITIASDPSNLNFKADEDPYITSKTFIWQELTTHTIQIDSIIERTSSHRLSFKSWNPNNTRNFQLTVESDAQWTASYLDQYQLIVESEDTSKGHTTLLSQDPWFDIGDTATCIAVSAPNYRFSHWSGDTSSSLPELSLVIDQPISVTAHFTNAPPIILTADTSVAEDDTLVLTLTDMEQWIQDDNTPISSLVFSFLDSDYLTPVYNEETHSLSITSDLNWFGRDTIWITVADPLGASSSAPMVITVNPEPDPPASFELLSPKHETGVSEWPTTIEFTWEAAIDPDPGDTLTYIFELDTSLSFQSSIKIKIENIQWMQYILLWPRHLGNNTYYWRVIAKDQSGFTACCNSPFTLALTTHVASSGQAIPKDFLLEQNYPNPFNGSTTIRYGLPRDERIMITVFNSYGQIVKKIFQGNQNAGYHTILWHGQDDQGQSVSSGMYMIVLQANHQKWVKKALLLQ